MKKKKTKKTSENWHQQWKALDKAKREYFDQEVNEIMTETYVENEAYDRLIHYNETKKMRWWHYCISFGIALFLTGLSFLIGYLTRNSSKTPDYQATGWASLGFSVLLILVFMIINYVKNRSAERYFRDKRRRYQRTLSDTEAKQFLALKILFLAFVLLTIVTIVTNIVFQP